MQFSILFRCPATLSIKAQSCQVEPSQSPPKILRTACVQRGGGFTQAGALVRLGREQMMMLPALCQTSLHPRLRETARYLSFFLHLYIVYFGFTTFSATFTTFN